MGCPPGTYLAGYDNFGLPNQSPICNPVAASAVPTAAEQAGFTYAQSVSGVLEQEPPLSVLETLPGCVIGNAPGQCPMHPDGSCTDIYGNPGGSCALIRECDPCDGLQHVEYKLPSGNVPNANTWSAQADGTFVWLGPNGTPAPPPQGAAPPHLDKGVFTSQFNPTTQAAINAAATKAGLQYDPSAGWVPIAGSAPNETQPGIAGFTAPSSVGSSGNTQGSTAVKNAAVGTAGAPGTSGVKTAVVAPPKNNFLILALVAGAILLLSRS